MKEVHISKYGGGAFLYIDRATEVFKRKKVY